MSAWLGGWLRDIVLIILFAAFVDLLIPNNSLQRYVKVVISLIILLTIMSPVITLLRSDMNTKLSADRLAGTGIDVGMKLPSLAHVLDAGEQLRKQSEARSFHLAEEQAAGMIRQRIGERFDIEPADVDVRIRTDKDGKPESIDSIGIALKKSHPDSNSNNSDKSDNTKSARDDRVKPVTIEVEVAPVKRIGSSPKHQADPSPDNRTSEERQLEQDIRAHLREWLGVPERIVDIQWR